MIFPWRNAARRIGSCGASQLILMALARFHIGSSQSSCAARSEPTKFGMRVSTPGKRATPASMSRVRTFWRISSLVMELIEAEKSVLQGCAGVNAFGDCGLGHAARHDDETRVSDHAMLRADAQVLHVPEPQQCLKGTNGRECPVCPQRIHELLHLHHRRYVADDHATVAQRGRRHRQ